MNEGKLNSEFEGLLRSNRGRINAIARAYAGSEADDLLQDICLQLWRSVKSFRGKSNIDTWCYRVALNTAISWQRKTSRRNTELALVSADINEVQGTSQGEDSVRLLERFMQTLSAPDRAVLLMYLDDLSGAEMAEVTGMKENSLRVRIHRIKLRLADWNAGDA